MKERILKVNNLPTDFNKDFVLEHIHEVANIIKDALNDCANYVLEENNEAGLLSLFIYIFPLADITYSHKERTQL